MEWSFSSQVGACVLGWYQMTFLSWLHADEYIARRLSASCYGAGVEFYQSVLWALHNCVANEATHNLVAYGQPMWVPCRVSSSHARYSICVYLTWLLVMQILRAHGCETTSSASLS